MTNKERNEQDRVNELKAAYLDKRVVIQFNLFEITGLVINIDNTNFHLVRAVVRHLRREPERTTEHPILTVSRACIMVGLVV